MTRLDELGHPVRRNLEPAALEESEDEPEVVGALPKARSQPVDAATAPVAATSSLTSAIAAVDVR